MPKLLLTDKWIENNLKCPADKRRIEYCDTRIPGLYIEARATSPGQGTYYLRYKDSTGKTAHQRLGTTDALDLVTCRQRAKTLKAEIQLGRDPRAEAEKQKQCVTWSDFFTDHYLVYKRSHGKRTLKNDEEMHRLRIKAQFGDTPLNKINQLQIQKFHMDLKESGLSAATADHHLKLLRHALNLAVDWGLLKTNPALKVKQYNQTRKLDRALDATELERLMRTISRDKNRMVCNFISMALALGTRKGELLKAEWRHVNREKKTLFIPGENAKSSRDRIVHLSEFALQILDDLGTEKKSPYLFINTRTGNRLTEVSKVWGRLRTAANLEDCTIHALRRTHATMLGEAGVNAVLIRDALGHTSVDTTQIYVSAHDDARNRAANIAGGQLTAALNAAR